MKVIAAREGRLDAGILLGLAAGVEDDLAARPSHHDAEEGHDHDDFESLVVTLDPVADPDALLARLVAVSARHDVLRIKGFVAVAGKPLRLLVQGVGARFARSFDRPWAPGEAREGRLVVIGRKGLDAAAVRIAIRGHAGSGAAAA